jgi:regulatory protein
MKSTGVESAGMEGAANGVDELARQRTLIRRSAIRFLARREYSVGELSDRMQSRFPDVSSEIVDEALAALADAGLQSDERLAEAWVWARSQRGQGPVKIRSELRTKRVLQDLIDGALSASGMDWHESAQVVCQKRFGPDRPQDQRERGQRSRFMLQRGFKFEHFSSLL